MPNADLTYQRTERMNSLYLSYVGALLPFVWGVAHLFPTRNVVKGFGDISEDNRRIVAMEWIVEGVALIFIGLLVASVTYVDSESPVSKVVYVLSSLVLTALAIVSLRTGARITFVMFKLCPVIFLSSGLLIMLGAYL